MVNVFCAGMGILDIIAGGAIIFIFGLGTIWTLFGVVMIIKGGISFI